MGLFARLVLFIIWMSCLAGEGASDWTSRNIQTGVCIQQGGSTVIVLLGHGAKFQYHILHRELRNRNERLLDNQKFPCNFADVVLTSQRLQLFFFFPVHKGLNGGGRYIVDNALLSTCGTVPVKNFQLTEIFPSGLISTKLVFYSFALCILTSIDVWQHVWSFPSVGSWIDSEVSFIEFCRNWKTF